MQTHSGERPNVNESESYSFGHGGPLNDSLNSGPKKDRGSDLYVIFLEQMNELFTNDKTHVVCSHKMLFPKNRKKSKCDMAYLSSIEIISRDTQTNIINYPCTCLCIYFIIHSLPVNWYQNVKCNPPSFRRLISR